MKNLFDNRWFWFGSVNIMFWATLASIYLGITLYAVFVLLWIAFVEKTK